MIYKGRKWGYLNETAPSFFNARKGIFFIRR